MISLRITLLSGEEVAIKETPPGTALLDVRKQAEDLLKRQLTSLADKDGRVLEDQKTLQELDLKDGDTLSAVVADLDALVERVKDSINKKYEILCGTQRQGNWVIVKVCENQDRKEEDYFKCYLYHLPSWTPGCKPLAQSNWTDNSCMGVRDSGSKLEFGEKGTVLEKDAGFGGLMKTIELSTLQP